MAHKHSVYDTDNHFRINAITRLITTAASGKTILIQGDHNSERFTFEMPRFVEEHDMLECNKVEVHYINIEEVSMRESRDVYPVVDLQKSPVDDNIVICSWLISANATMYKGALSFALRFACLTGSTIDYAWNSAECTLIQIGKGIYNTEAVSTQYSDTLQRWYEELVDASAQGVNAILTAQSVALEDLQGAKKEAIEELSAKSEELVDIVVEKAVDKFIISLPQAEEVSV